MIAQRNRRFGARLRTDLAVTTYHRGEARACRAVDLSPTGALIQRRSTTDPPLLHDLELDLSHREPLRTLARTVWSKDNLMGVRFVGLSDVDRLDIAEELDRRSA